VSRALTSAAFQAILAQETPEAFALLLTITVPGASPIYMADAEDIVSNGNSFLAYPFSLQLPTDENGQVTEARLTIDNVARTLIDEIRTLSQPLSLLMEVVMISDPDNILIAYPDFELTNVTYDQLTISGALTLENFLQEPYPKDVLSASNFPGLF